MFERAAHPRVFALPPGVDFARELVGGLLGRTAGQAPEALARVTLLVNTRRTQRRLLDLLAARGPLLLPRVQLVTDLAPPVPIPPAVPPLRRRLELTGLVAALLDRQPDLAPRTALYDLADSLADLMDEMQGEGVPPSRLASLDLSVHSAHWARSLAFIGIVARYFEADAAPDVEARHRRAVEALAAEWKRAPPADPVIVAGSTGSRGTTARLMEAVAGLPQGALVLPGYDFDMPPEVWAALRPDAATEDHPQHRFARLLDRLDRTPADVAPWTVTAPADPARNRLVSLALRPAPVTDRWIAEGPRLGDVGAATGGLTLIEAPSPRAEALAIALLLREAAETGVTAALITPDRVLTRQVAAALDRWRIVADDSAGEPLALSAPGRFLRQVAEIFGVPMTATSLLALLKHPLVATGADRGSHLRFTRDFELRLRRFGPPYPTAATLTDFAARHADDTERQHWAAWVGDWIDVPALAGTQSLADHVAAHVRLAAHLSAGAGGTSGALWDGSAGAEALDAMTELGREAPHGGRFGPADYAALFTSVLNRREVREPSRGHPRIMIWGTLEARVQGADLTILAGLNEGTWPRVPPPDAWLNRAMRRDAGLLLPDRQIGLSAHDFQQAVAGRRVVLARAVRAEADLVPSRWLNRMMNLLGGLEGGTEALGAMRSRGAVWLERATALDAPETRVRPEPRPSPSPPLAERPTELAVTSITRLLRDPYAIYARHVLGLKPLDPLLKVPDARGRGTILHEVLQRFVEASGDESPDDARRRLVETARTVLDAEVPWPSARALWQARIERVADWFVAREAATVGRPALIEDRGAVDLPQGIRITARPDRIDVLPDGRLHIYDYKTGSPPSKDAQKTFEKQLLIEAAMAERGAFANLGRREVAAISYIGLGTAPDEVMSVMTRETSDATWDELGRLIARYGERSQGYTARRAPRSETDRGDYDHLARYGEWETSDAATIAFVGGDDA